MEAVETITVKQQFFLFENMMHMRESIWRAMYVDLYNYL